MKHIISNPHNGADVDVNGITLEPGYEIVVDESTANSLTGRYGFLLHRVENGTADPLKAKPKKIKGTLEFQHDSAPEDAPEPDSVSHVITPPKKGK